MPNKMVNCRDRETVPDSRVYEIYCQKLGGNLNTDHYTNATPRWYHRGPKMRSCKDWLNAER